jgi:hypothetical protein
MSIVSFKLFVYFTFIMDLPIYVLPVISGHGSAIPSLSSHGSTPQYSSYGGYQGTSKTIEIPNGRVGVIIGKSGETIKNLQLQSGAKIQVTRDLDALPGSQTRPVELSGTPDQISRAEQLINEVLAEVILLRSWLSFYHFRDDLTLAEHLVRWPYLLFM